MNQHQSSLPIETMQRLIDYAHAVMSKRPDHPDDYPINSSRLQDGHCSILAKDLRELQKLGKPSWEQDS